MSSRQMRPIRVFGCALGAMMVLFLHATPARAQATRTWVSGVGDDANPCSRTAPCKTFAGAISKTAASGEIDCLDPGGFGAVTIIKAITIDCRHTMGGILASLTNGVIVNAGSGDVIILRGLSIDGAGNGVNGIRFLSAKEVVVDSCRIFGFTGNGIDMPLVGTGVATVRNTHIEAVGGRGIFITSSGGFAVAHISDSHFTAAPTGVEAGNGAFTTVKGSVFEWLTTGAKATGNAVMNLDDSSFANNGTGVNGGAGTTVRVSNNSLYDNTTGFVVGGTFASASNNRVVGPTGNPNAVITIK